MFTKPFESLRQHVDLSKLASLRYRGKVGVVVSSQELPAELLASQREVIFRSHR